MSFAEIQLNSGGFQVDFFPPGAMRIQEGLREDKGDGFPGSVKIWKPFTSVSGLLIMQQNDH